MYVVSIIYTRSLATGYPLFYLELVAGASHYSSLELEVLDLEDLELEPEGFEKIYFPTANSKNKYRYVEYINAPNARFDSTLLQVPGAKCALPNNL